MFTHTDSTLISEAHLFLLSLGGRYSKKIPFIYPSPTFEQIKIVLVYYPRHVKVWLSTSSQQNVPTEASSRSSLWYLLNVHCQVHNISAPDIILKQSQSFHILTAYLFTITSSSWKLLSCLPSDLSPLGLPNKTVFSIPVGKNVKVKFALEETMKAHSRSRGTALFFL